MALPEFVPKTRIQALVRAVFVDKSVCVSHVQEGLQLSL